MLEFNSSYILANTMLGNTSYNNNSTTTMPSPIYCFAMYDYIQYSTDALKNIFYVLFGLTVLISTSLNSAVVYCIIKTRQWQSQSTFLVLIASVCDVLSCLTSDVWHIVYIAYVNVMPCQLKIIVFAFNHLWVHGAAYSFCMISIDRYFRVRYLQTYPEVMTPRRFRAMVGIYGLMTLVQSVLLWYGATYAGDYGGPNWTKPVNLVIMLVTLFFYFISIRLLKDLKKQQQHISDETRKLTNMAAIYLTLFTMFYLPTVIFQFTIEPIFSVLSKTEIGIVTFLLCFISSMHGLLNAVGFLTKNRQSRRLVVTKYLYVIRRLRFSNAVTPTRQAIHSSKMNNSSGGVVHLNYSGDMSLSDV